MKRGDRHTNASGCFRLREESVRTAIEEEAMKKIGFMITALCLLTAPAQAVEYQGKNLDGIKLPAKVTSYNTGGEYDVQVQFKQNLATIYFSHGGQTTIRLTQRVITDPNKIEGIGKLGQVYLGSVFSVGLDFDRSTGDVAASVVPTADYLWSIRLDPDSLTQATQTTP
jgi:hypothetical protein